MTKYRLWVLVLFGCLVSCSLRDPVESKFILIGSRMPSWYQEGIGRDPDETIVEFTIHTSGVVDINIKDKYDCNSLARRSGRYSGSFGLPGKSMLDYPRYMAIAVDGKEDSYEIRKPGPYVYFAEAPPEER
jgi:hypothetical protein